VKNKSRKDANCTTVFVVSRLTLAKKYSTSSEVKICILYQKILFLLRIQTTFLYKSLFCLR